MTTTGTETKLKTKKKSDLGKRIRQKKHIYIILLPAILFYLIFCYAPMGGLVMAFQKFSVTKGFFGSEFVGLKNFTSFLSDQYFWRLLRNTLMINFWGLLFGFPTPIIFALLLNEIKNTKFKKSVQTITYMPHFLSVVVVAGLVLTFVSSDGLINSIIQLFGGEKIQFMTEPKYFYRIYVTSDI